MRWFYYGVALVATALSALLWFFVLGGSGVAPSVPEASPLSASIPVAPALRPALAVSVAGSRDVRLFCLAGFVARQTGDSVETLLVDGRPVPCP